MDLQINVSKAKAYGHYQEASLHLRHALELKPEFEPAVAALKDMESLPDTTIHVYTLLIIVCLVSVTGPGSIPPSVSL
uniref:Uncharacterized protein n=1 Tax=Timema douglasi TaxID=61478 RepID=A0A7R8VYE7_TIMDO|nr:unnamed protein product [Timema douglasi]